VESGWLALHHSHISLKEIALGTHWMESWVGPEAGIDSLARRKVSLLGNNVNHYVNVCGALYKLHDFFFCLTGKRKVLFGIKTVICNDDLIS
jgi:hypothetical protein